MKEGQHEQRQGESLVFVEDTQVVLLIKQITEFLYSGQSHTVVPIVSKTILVLAFRIHTSGIVVYGHSRHFAMEWDWGPEGFSTSRSQTWLPGSG